MKIVDVAEFYADKGGGVRTYVNAKLRAGASAGHEVVVIAPGPRDGEERRHGGRVVWIKGPPMPFDPRYFVLYREAAVHAILDREQPDVVEGSSPWSGGWFAARWRGRAKKAFIFHQDPIAVYPQTLLGRSVGADRVDRLFAFYWAYLKRLSSHYDATIVSGQWLAARLASFQVQRPIAVPFGIDKGIFSPDRRSAEIKQRLLSRIGAPPGSRLMITISRMHPEKRLGVLIEAYRRAAAERPLAWVIYGDGPLRPLVERQLRGLSGVHLAGFTTDREALADTMASADLMLHGSAAETYGLVVAEALCSGLPVVVPHRGGAHDLAGPGHAEVYETGDAEGCARAIERLLCRDAERLRAACAKASAEQIGTMDDHFSQLFAFYGRLVAGTVEIGGNDGVGPGGDPLAHVGTDGAGFADRAGDRA